MILLSEYTLPFKDPVLIFCIVLLIILFTPILFKKINFPSIIGLIIAGVVIGPYGFNLLLRDASIELFGTVGLLYIMFIAGLEIDLTEFKINKNKSIVFGAITFIVPMALGTLAGLYVLGLNFPASILLASMFASHTLLSYPITSSYGINKLEPVNITVGGTIITDTAALLVLAVVAGSASGDLDFEFWIRLCISLIIFVFIVVWIIPRVSRWFFKKLDGQGEAQFLFSLSVVFGSAFLAEVAGVEPIIGAFLSGLVLNRFIPHTSPLMNRIEFVGNTLFIPFFLIGVGMLVDVRVFFQGGDALFVALVMVVIAIVAKYLAALGAQQLYKYSSTERNIIFGLSSAQAAATLAVVLVGYNLKIFDSNVLNGTIIMILVTCLISSFVTEKASKKLAAEVEEEVPDKSKIQQRILVPIESPENVENLIDLAIMIKDPDSTEPLYPLSVVKDDDETTDHLILNKKILEKAVKYGSASENEIRLVSRIDENVAQGILRCIREMLITEVVIGWDGVKHSDERVYGKVLDEVLESISQMVFISKILIPLNTIKNIFILVPKNAEKEEAFSEWIEVIKKLSKEMGADLTFFSSESTKEAIEKVLKETKPVVEYEIDIFEDWTDFLVLSRYLSHDDLFLIINARKGSVSFNNELEKIPGALTKHFQEYNFIILFPSVKEKVAQQGDTDAMEKKGLMSRLKYITGGVTR